MAYTEQDRRNHIRELQQYLYSLSFLDETLPRLIPDGIYGGKLPLLFGHFNRKTGCDRMGKQTVQRGMPLSTPTASRFNGRQHRCIFIHQSGNCWGLEKQGCWCWCCKAS